MAVILVIPACWLDLASKSGRDLNYAKYVINPTGMYPVHHN